MSTLETNLIQPATGTTVTLGASGDTIDASNADFKPKYQLGNRNLIINGAMNVAQRGTQVTGVTSSGYKTCDRWNITLSGLGTWTIDQSTDAPNGFSNSFKVTCTTADASPAAGDYCILYYFIESQNLQHLGFGTTDAKSMTLSFWVKSNKTGSASFGIQQMDNSSKMISKSYTINSADTWEYKTISIPSDTAGVINNDNGRGFLLEWWLNSGSGFTGGSHATTWSTYNATNRNASNLGVGGAVSDYFAITGVQLELGDVATPFEHESYGETLQKCKRYFESIYVSSYHAAGFCGASSSVAYGANIYFTVEKRASPTVTLPSAGTATGEITFVDYNGNYPSSTGTHSVVGSTVNRFEVRGSGYSGLSTTSTAFLYGFVTYKVDAEL